MNKRDRFLLLFVKSFYDKGRGNPNTDNQVHWTVIIINKIFKNHFKEDLSFTEAEVLKAFKRNGFKLSEYGENEFTWEKFHANHITIYNDKFLNIKVRNNKDLGNTWKQHKSNYKQETIDKIDNLKADLFKFWDDNKHLLE
ncbi:hypothetical protein [Gramella sp. AN32]|uniref:Uncharacterized protein n=1 Tax=Christiangramia antarctica TaxID=2058158 RepID=A0ABW5X331_9FLAO|nr:hypothetical protein [Gramella sp. AN32]MCM4154968.1 hypothetical protein [Gramella sp. AN32]